MNTQLQGLYAITDETLMLPEKFALMAEAALAGGVSILQYRDKSDDHDKRLQQAYTLKELCLKYNATLIINDDIALATAVDADGIHIGKTDASLNVARQQLGAGKIIGVSCYNQLSLAEEAIHHGADYIAFGSLQLVFHLIDTYLYRKHIGSLQIPLFKAVLCQGFIFIDLRRHETFQFFPICFLSPSVIQPIL